MTGFEYFQEKVPTGATIAVIIALLSTVLTRDEPFSLGGVFFFLGVWLAGTIIASVILMVVEMIRDRL